MVKICFPIRWGVRCRSPLITGLNIQNKISTILNQVRLVSCLVIRVRETFLGSSSRMEWISTFLLFSKSDTFLPIRFTFVSYIPKNQQLRQHAQVKTKYFLQKPSLYINEQSPKRKFLIEMFNFFLSQNLQNGFWSEQ